MNKEEFDKLKTGDIVYKVFPLNSIYYKAVILKKEATTLELLIKGCTHEDTYSNVFTSEEKARKEIIRRFKDKIMTKVSSIRHLMVSLYSFDNDALNDKLLCSITNAINKEFNKLKEE